MLERGMFWEEEVLLRLSSLDDLIHPNERYHCFCYSRFQGKDSTKLGEAASRGGSTGDEERVAAFEKIRQYLVDNDERQYILKELKNLFCSLIPGIDPYSKIHLKRKLLHRYVSSM